MTTMTDTGVRKRTDARFDQARYRANLSRLVKKFTLKDPGDQDWMNDPARPMRCAGVLANGVLPDEAFFPVEVDDRRWQATAELLCDRCPVKADCLAYGYKYGYPGLWGGHLITQRELDERRARERVERRQRREAAGHPPVETHRSVNEG